MPTRMHTVVRTDDQQAERLDDSDLGYHAHLMQQGSQLPALQEQAQRIAQTVAGIQGAQRSWSGYLQEKYRLQDGDEIGQDGTIIRHASLPVGPIPESNGAT